MKRQKRKYLILMISSVVLTFSIVFLLTSLERAFTYGEATATIISVETKERKGGTSGDRYYYTESDVRCSYTVNDRIYQKEYTIKADYSGDEGNKITILYDKSNPYNSVVGTNKITAVLFSAFLTIGSVCYIIFDIRKWVEIRRNENKLQSDFSENDQQYENQKAAAKKTNTVLIILSLLLFIPLSVMDLILIVFTIARIIDYRMCYKISSATEIKRQGVIK